MPATSPGSDALQADLMACADIAGDFEISLGQVDYYLAIYEMNPFQQYNVSGILSRHGRIEEATKYLRASIDGGWSVFSNIDPEWFLALKGTPEHDFIVGHIHKFTP